MAGTDPAGTQTDADELEFFHLLREFAVRFGLRQAEFAAAHGMHPTDVRALIRLLDAERAGIAATAGYLGEGLGLNSAGTTSVIDRLDRLGCLTRVRDPADRRRVLLRVNERARELGWAHFGPMIRETTAALQGLGDQERAVVRDFLTAARDAVAAERPGRGPGAAAFPGSPAG